MTSPWRKGLSSADLDAAGWDERYRAKDRLWSAAANLFVADRLSTMVPGTGLDLAAGDGRNAIWLAERGWSVTAIDFSEVAVERGRTLTDRVDFVVGDVRTWSSDESFDLVLISYLHLPMDEMRSVVASASARLASGGELFMIGHDRSNIERGTGGPQDPEILWSVGEVTSRIDSLTVIEAQVVRRPVETENGQISARDALIRARA